MMTSYYLRRAVANPHHALRVLAGIPRCALNVSRAMGPLYGLGYLLYYFSLYTGIPLDSPFWRWAKKKHGVVTQRPVMGHDMLLDLNDKGISRQLFLEGRREKGVGRVFVRQLTKLHRAVGGHLNILEIGANIGYYALIEALAIKDSTIYAVEPHPTNVELLKKNVQLHGLGDRIRITQAAISDHTGTGRLYLSNQWNVHSMEKQSPASLAVQTLTVDDFLMQHGLSADDIHVVRMDVEGHESSILKGMRAVLSLLSPMLMFIEFHTELVRHGALDATIGALQTAGFSIVYGCHDYFTGPVEEFYTWQALARNLKHHADAEVLLVRGYGQSGETPHVAKASPFRKRSRAGVSSRLGRPAQVTGREHE